MPASAGTESSGYAIVLVPESTLPPHRVLLTESDVQSRYFVRSGESFVVASHTQLEDMFGRRPHPNLALSYRLYSNIGERRVEAIIGITNTGRGTARAPYLAIQVQEPFQISRYELDGNGHAGLERLTVATDKIHERRYGGSTNVVIHPGVTHDVTVVRYDLPGHFEIDTTKPLLIEYTLAAEGVALKTDQLLISGPALYGAAP